MKAIWIPGAVVRNTHDGTVGILMSPWVGLDLSISVMTPRGVESWTVADTEVLNEAR